MTPPDANTSADVRVIATAVDRPFTIHLWEDRTRGEQWVPAYDARLLTLLSDEFLRQISLAVFVVQYVNGVNLVARKPIPIPAKV